jgi:hypothetical protein
MKVLVNQTEPEGFSLLEAIWRPGDYIPRHRHNVPEAVLVLDGSLTLIDGGSANEDFLVAGDGFFTPAGHVWAYAIGPRGATWVEYRHCSLSELGTEYVEDDPAKWIVTPEVPPAEQSD